MSNNFFVPSFFSILLLYCASFTVVAKNQPASLPVFSHSVAEKKKQFFEFLLPIASEVNDNISETRGKILRFKSIGSAYLAPKEISWLEMISQQYGMKDWQVSSTDAWQELISRVDTIPLSIVLAQAATESGWGASRFATQGNNLFGEWCYKKGCGIVPKERTDGAAHEVRYFTSIYDSVESYVHNLNTHYSHKQFRSIRQDMRNRSKKLDAINLAHGLRNYSERRDDYVRDIKMIINFNKLEVYDQ